MIPQDHRDRGNRADPYTEPNSCFSDSSDSLNSLNSLNSMKVQLHLEKTPSRQKDFTPYTLINYIAKYCHFDPYKQLILRFSMRKLAFNNLNRLNP